MKKRQSIRELLSKPFMRFFLGLYLLSSSLICFSGFLPIPQGLRLPLIVLLTAPQLLLLPVLEAILLLRERRFLSIMRKLPGLWLLVPVCAVACYLIQPRIGWIAAMVIGIWAGFWPRLMAQLMFRVKKLGWL